MGGDARLFVTDTMHSNPTHQSPARRVVQHAVGVRVTLAACLAASLVVAAVCPVAWAAGAAMAPLRPLQYTNRLIVTLKSGPAAAAGVAVAPVQDLSVTAGVALRRLHAMADGQQVFELPARLTLQQVEDIAARLRGNPGVQDAEPDRMVYPSAVPNDPYYSLQWHYMGPADGEPGGADLPRAWDITSGDPAVVIAVLDTGILPHADLAGRTVPGYDFISDARTANDGDGRDADPSDPGDWITAQESNGTDATKGFFSGCAVADSTWHGTHVAGTLAAATDNNLGVAGINWTSKLLPVRVLGKCGGYTSDIVDAIRWAAGLPVPGVPNNTHPARVINLSLSGAGPCSQAEQQAIDDAVAVGSTVVVAAGNDGQDAANYHPGNCRGVIDVAADDRQGGQASYSNYGAAVAITAPGGDASGIYSTLDRGTQGPLHDNSYAYYIGTSMAAAHVSGVVSLMLSANYAVTHAMLSPATVLAKLRDSARAFPAGTGFDCNPSTCGAGLLDGANAVRAVSTPPVADAGADQVAQAGSAVTLAAAGSVAPGGVIVRYAWAQTAGAPVTIINSDTSTPSFIAPSSGGELTFRLTVTNDVGLTASDTVAVAVNGGSNAPVAKDQQITLEEDSRYAGALSASGSVGAGLTYTIVTNGDKGGAVISDPATGQFTYTPYANSNGRDSFTFQVSDGTAASNIATVSVVINPVNHPPVATAMAFTTASDRAYTGRLAAGDVDGNPLTYGVVTPPAQGVVTLSLESGDFTYTPYARAAGSDTFTYRVSDGTAYSGTVPVYVTLNGGVDNPVLVNHGANGLVLIKGATRQLPFDAVDPDTANNADADVYSVTPSSLGSAAFSGNVLSFTAAAAGSELLTVTVRDSSGNTDSMMLPVTVNPPEAADANHDGLSDAQASAAGLDPNAVDGDTDGDGVDDALEVGNPQFPADSDGDNVIDALEFGAAAADASRMTFVVSRPAAAQLGLPGLAGQLVSISVNGGASLRGHVNGKSGIPLYSKATVASHDPNYDYPYGLLDFSVTTAASSVKITITLPGSAPLPANATVRKQDVRGIWRSLPGAVIDAGHRTATLTLTDNDDFDLDPAAGVIRDPVGVAVPTAVSPGSEAPSNATGQGSASGGGAVDPFTVLAGLWAWRRRRCGGC